VPTSGRAALPGVRLRSPSWNFTSPRPAG